MASRRFFDGAQLELGLLPLEIYSTTSSQSAFIEGHDPATDSQSLYTHGHRAVATNTNSSVSDTFTGSDGSAIDSSKWIITQGGTYVIDIRSNQMSIDIGASGGTNTILLNETISDFDLYFDFTTTTKQSRNYYFRRTDNNNTYLLYIAKNQVGFNYAQFYRVVGGVQTQLGSNISGVMSASGDTVHLRIRMVGNVIQIKKWLNAASEPGTWNIDVVDETYSSGSFYSLTSSPSDLSSILYIDNFSLTALNQDLPMYIEGSVGATPISDSQDAYVRGHTSNTSNNNAYVRGHIAITDSQDAYIRGLSTTTDSSDAYVRGHVSDSSNKSAYVRGLEFITDSEDLYVHGHSTITSNVSAYVRGFSSVADSQDAYVRGLESLTDSEDAYTRGHTAVTTQVDAYIRGLLSSTSSTDLYVRGSTAITDSNDAYVRGYESATDSQNLYVEGTSSGVTPISDSTDLFTYGHDMADSYISAYIRGVPTTPITLGSKWAYIMSWSNRIYSSQSLYVESPENFMSSTKRAHITGVPVYSSSGNTLAYISGEELTTTLFDMMIGVETDGTTHASFDMLVLLNGDGTGQFPHATILNPIEEIIYTEFAIPTEAFPFNKEASQDTWITTYTEAESTKRCFVNAGFIGGYDQGYRKCFVVTETPSTDSLVECYIEGEQFVVSTTPAYVVGGVAPSKTSSKYCYLNADRDYVEITIQGYVSGHNYASSTKKCYVPTVNFSQNRKQLYIEGS